ncbi:DUF2827 domain-containing protein [Paraburkholderia phymatum]|uniref:DUF2827 domain-containing protein n=1 Tax=Paraburkholderia phymatum TaxID=148447 RepID=A0ACC6TWX5_9BURK
MRIGISVLTHEGQNIWENGLGQNIVFLAEAFQRLPFVESVVLIDVGNQKALAPQVDTTEKRLALLTMREAGDVVDVIVEMGGALDGEWLQLMRARGKRVVYYCCGQPFAGLAESPVFSKPAHALRPDRCDEVWLLPKDATLLTPMMRVQHRCSVYEVPFIWHPQFVQQRIDEVAKLSLHYGYTPRRTDEKGNARGLRVAILEPNISVVKTSSIPMLVCDLAYRKDTRSVSAMHVLNTLHMKDHLTMLHFSNSLDLVRTHKATFHGRHDVVGFMVQHAEAVVAHQWENAQNYAYLDVLYGNYPLIHNSPWLRDAGYYYPDFDADEGARKLLYAADHHDESLTAYSNRSNAVFKAVDPFNPRNLSQYALRLKHLIDSRQTTTARGV